MEFLFPGFLLALATLAVPVIIHLFYFRRFRKVYFTSVRFLREIKEEQSARRKLRNLLVLAMRILALAMLVLAFAHPFLPGNEVVNRGHSAVSIYIDNSFSMEALSEEAPLIAKARQRAREVISAYGPADEFQVLTNELEGSQQFLVNREEALALIDNVTTSPAVRPLSQILGRQKQALAVSEATERVSYIISDFQQSVADISGYADTTLLLNFIPLQAVREKNVGIDSVWFSAPVQMAGQNNTLFVRLTNYAEGSAENVRLSIDHDGQEKPVGTLELPPASSVIDTINMTISRPGWQRAVLKLTDYPVTFDDTYHFAFEVPEYIDVLVIDEGAPDRFLDAAFAGAGLFRVTHQPRRSITYSALGTYDLIIANDLPEISSGLAAELKSYLSAGGNLLVFPSIEANLESYNAFLSLAGGDRLLSQINEPAEARTINTEEFIFKDVFENRSANLRLPRTTVSYRFDRRASSLAEPLIAYRDGNAYLAKYPVGRGHLYACASPLSPAHNSLSADAEIFVPMLYKMSISSGADRQIAYFIGKNAQMTVSTGLGQGDPVFRVISNKGEFIPATRTVGELILLNIDDETLTADGFYQLAPAGQDTTVKLLAFNYDRRESDLSAYSISELTELAGPQVVITDGMSSTNLTMLIGEKNRGIPLWRICLVLALGFLATESILLRTTS